MGGKSKGGKALSLTLSEEGDLEGRQRCFVTLLLSPFTVGASPVTAPVHVSSTAW